MNNDSKNPSENNVYVFIDASNLWQAQKVKGCMFDYKKLKSFLQQKFNASSLKIFYYTAYPAEGTREYATDGKHKFFTYLKKGLGYFVIKKELKRIHVVNEFGDAVEEKGNMDYVFSSKNNVSQELRTGGDRYFDVLEIKEDIWGRALQRRRQVKN